MAETSNRKFDPFWGYMVRIGMNIGADHAVEANPGHMSWKVTRGDPVFIDCLREGGKRDYLRCDRDYWHELIESLAAAGINVALIDLMEGVKYESHPELAVKGSWTTAELHESIKHMRALGIEPIPKLNFSTCHDSWLGEYSRMVSTGPYYRVCSDLIAEVCDLFDNPRFFHIGMDEENSRMQQRNLLVIYRQSDLWWHDLKWFAEEVRKHDVRPMMWSDMWWEREDELSECPQDIVQCNWYYGDMSVPTPTYLSLFAAIDKAGFDQVPTGSTFFVSNNMELVARKASLTIAPERLLGFFQAPWIRTDPRLRHRHREAIAETRKAMRVFADDSPAEQNGNY